MKRIYASIGLGNESHNSKLVACPNHDQNSSVSKWGLSGFIGEKLRAGMEPEPSMHLWPSFVLEFGKIPEYL